MNYLRKNWILLIILAIGLLLRLYKFDELFSYGHDQDLLGWTIRDILENKHLRLIGQETTNQGVFIGPLFYYLLIPFYLITKMDPIGGIIYSTLIGMASIFSFYYVFKKIFSENVGLIASLIYSISFYTIFTDREVVPTNSVMLWSVWYLYSLYLLYKSDPKKGFLLAGLLMGLAWHINLALIIISPLVVLSYILAKRKTEIKNILAGGAVLLVVSSPFILFEARNNFSQIKSITRSLTTEKNYIPGTSKGVAKLDRVFQLVFKNSTSLFFESNKFVRQDLTFYFILITFIFLVARKILDWKFALIFFVWQLIYIAFFTINSLNPSEYYFNGMNVIWIGIFSLFIDFLIRTNNLKIIAYIIIILFIFSNLDRIRNIAPNKSGYIEKGQIVKFIREDSTLHNYPCVSVSYITKPGYNFGYRYFFYLKKMHVNSPSSQSPVYSIVFPHDFVDKIDKSFGALGLVLPDYERYNEKDVLISCSGQNSNLTDPMFGFVQ